MTAVGAGAAADTASLDRSHLLLALAERERLERVLRMLPLALCERSPEGIAAVLADAACVVTSARVAVVLLPELLGGPVVAGPDAESVGTSVDPDRLWDAAGTAEHGSVHLSDLGGVDEAPQQTPGLATADGRPLRCLSSFPIFGDGEVRGALVLAHHRVGAFSERQLELVGALVAHLAGAVDMCDAVAGQTRIATALQETLLPPVLPAIDGVELSACYRPGGSGNLVGGDFYDVFTDGDGGWYLLLGDASGIGPEAAGLAGVARYTARALAESASGPTEMLSQINLALLRAAPEDRFCTAVLARIGWHSDGTLDFWLGSAGHPPPLVLQASGDVLPATDATGFLLGVSEDAIVGEARVRLGPGDAVALYTDGVIEARAASGDRFGDDRLRQTLHDARNRSAAGIARRLERAVLDHRSPDDRDDMAIVVVRVPRTHALATGS